MCLSYPSLVPGSFNDRPHPFLFPTGPAAPGKVPGAQAEQELEEYLVNEWTPDGAASSLFLFQN